MLDKAISTDKKYSMNDDSKFHENSVEIQSIELACFILAVCNVVIVAEDWFTDLNLFRLIQTAEMLIPNITANLTVSQTNDEPTAIENHPHLGSKIASSFSFSLFYRSDYLFSNIFVVVLAVKFTF